MRRAAPAARRQAPVQARPVVDAVTPDGADLDPAIRAVSARLAEMYNELHAAHPALRESLAIYGAFVGYGLAAFVANDMTNDEIIASVLTIVTQLRQIQGAAAPVVS